MNSSITKKELRLPWQMIMIYFYTCFFLYLFGPWDYQYPTNFKTIVYIIVFGIVSTYSYNKAVAKFCKNHRVNIQYNNSMPHKILHILIIISLLSTLTMLILKIVENGIPDISNIFSAMANAYSNTRSEDLHIDQAVRLFYRVSPLIYLTISIGLYDYSKLGKKYKFFLILVIVFLATYTVLFSGQQKQIGDIVIIALSILIIKYTPTSFKVINKNKLLVGVSVIFVIFLFSSIMTERIIMMGISPDNAIYSHYSLNTDSIIFKVLPEGFALGFSFFIFYLSHGFYGLNLCLEQPFVWTMGLGSCPVIVSLLSNYIKFEGDILTYPYRTALATGWSDKSVWHTIFPWLASDFTYIGAIIILSLLAYLYGKCLCEIKYYNQWQSVFLFSVLSIIWFYMVANNQLFTAKSTLFVAIVAVILWLMRKIRLKFVVRR